jgi:hypothetical protein
MCQSLALDTPASQQRIAWSPRFFGSASEFHLQATLRLMNSAQECLRDIGLNRHKHHPYDPATSADKCLQLFVVDQLHSNTACQALMSNGWKPFP